MMLSAELKALRNDALTRYQGAAVRFFTPTAAFFAALEPYRGIRIVDAGAGMGHVAQEACKRGFDMLAVDLMTRDDQWTGVHIMEAESLPYGPTLWPLTCRPDHGGWAYDILEQSLRGGGCALYAGLDRNFERDLGDYVGREASRWENIGEEGESLFLFRPDALLARETID